VSPRTSDGLDEHGRQGMPLLRTYILSGTDRTTPNRNAPYKAAYVMISYGRTLNDNVLSRMGINFSIIEHLRTTVPKQLIVYIYALHENMNSVCAFLSKTFRYSSSRPYGHFSSDSKQTFIRNCS